MTQPQLPEHYRLGQRLNPDYPVYEAVDARSGTSIAIKFGSPKSFLLSENNDAFRARLQAESSLLKRWAGCENVVRLLESYVDRDPPFLVLERLGNSIDAELPEDGLPLSEALEVAKDIAVALSDIHRLGGAHGDVTPANILRHPQTGRWTLIDPGASSLQTYEFPCEHLHGWERDMFMLGRVFITLVTGKIDEEFDDYVRGWFEDQPAGDRLVRLVDRMLWIPRSRRKQPRGARPTAVQVLTEFRRAAKLNPVHPA